MLTAREFMGSEFHGFCQQEYDAARRFLKTCGKEAGRFLIEYNRETAEIFGKFLDLGKKRNV